MIRGRGLLVGIDDMQQGDAALQAQIDALKQQVSAVTNLTSGPGDLGPLGTWPIAIRREKQKVVVTLRAAIPTTIVKLKVILEEYTGSGSSVVVTRTLPGNIDDLPDAAVAAGQTDFDFPDRLVYGAKYGCISMVAVTDTTHVRNPTTSAPDKSVRKESDYLPGGTFVAVNAFAQPSVPANILIRESALDSSTKKFDGYVILRVYGPRTDAGAAQTWTSAKVDWVQPRVSQVGTNIVISPKVRLNDTELAQTDPASATVGLGLPANMAFVDVRIHKLSPGALYSWDENLIHSVGEHSVASPSGAVQFYGGDIAAAATGIPELTATSLVGDSTDPNGGRNLQLTTNFTQPTPSASRPTASVITGLPVALKQVTILRDGTALHSRNLNADSWHTSGAHALPSGHIKTKKLFSHTVIARFEAFGSTSPGTTRDITLTVTTPNEIEGSDPSTANWLNQAGSVTAAQAVLTLKLGRHPRVRVSVPQHLTGAVDAAPRVRLYGFVLQSGDGSANYLDPNNPGTPFTTLAAAELVQPHNHIEISHKYSDYALTFRTNGLIASVRAYNYVVGVMTPGPYTLFTAPLGLNNDPVTFDPFTANWLNQAGSVTDVQAGLKLVMGRNARCKVSIPQHLTGTPDAIPQTIQQYGWAFQAGDGSANWFAPDNPGTAVTGGTSTAPPIGAEFITTQNKHDLSHNKSEYASVFQTAGLKAMVRAYNILQTATGGIITPGPYTGQTPTINLNGDPAVADVGVCTGLSAITFAKVKRAGKFVFHFPKPAFNTLTWEGNQLVIWNGSSGGLALYLANDYSTSTAAETTTARIPTPRKQVVVPVSLITLQTIFGPTATISLYYYAINSFGPSAASPILTYNLATGEADDLPIDTASPAAVTPTLLWTPSGGLDVYCPLPTTQMNTHRNTAVVIHNNNDWALKTDLSGGTTPIPGDPLPANLLFQLGKSGHHHVRVTKQQLLSALATGPGPTFAALTRGLFCTVKYYTDVTGASIPQSSALSNDATGAGDINALMDVIGKNSGAVGVLDAGTLLISGTNLITNGDFLYYDGSTVSVVNQWNSGASATAATAITTTAGVNGVNVAWTNSGAHELTYKNTAFSIYAPMKRRLTKGGDIFAFSFALKTAGAVASGSLLIDFVDTATEVSATAGARTISFAAFPLTANYQLFGGTLITNGTSDFTTVKSFKISVSSITLGTVNNVVIDKVMLVRGKQPGAFSPRAPAYEGNGTTPGGAEDITIGTQPTNLATPDIGNPSGTQGGFNPAGGTVRIGTN